MNTDFTLTQKRALAVVTIISLLFAGYFLRNYFVLIVVAAVGAYLFTPLFNRFDRRLKTGLAATCTLLTALAAVIVPIGLLVVLAIVQISRMVTHVAGWVQRTGLSGLGDKSLHVVNRVLARVPFLHMTVTAESLRAGLWKDLDPSQLASVLSALVYESRKADDAQSPRLPGGPVKEVLREMTALWADLDALERENKLDQLREPDFGFAFAAYRWAEGDDLDEVLDASGLAAGDFVRWVKQLLDLAGQVGDAATDPALRDKAREAVVRLRRGVVAYSSVAD